MSFYKTSIWSKSYRLAHFKTWSNKLNTNFLHYKVQTTYCEILGLHSMASSYHFNLIFNYFFIILRYTNCCVHCSALFWYWYTCLVCNRSWIFCFWEVKNALLRANEIKNNIHKKNNASHIISLHWNFFYIRISSENMNVGYYSGKSRCSIYFTVTGFIIIVHMKVL